MSRRWIRRELSLGSRVSSEGLRSDPRLFRATEVRECDRLARVGEARRGSENPLMPMRGCGDVRHAEADAEGTLGLPRRTARREVDAARKHAG